MCQFETEARGRTLAPTCRAVITDRLNQAWEVRPEQLQVQAAPQSNLGGFGRGRRSAKACVAQERRC